MPSETTGVSKLHKNLEALYCDELHTAAIALTAELGVVMIAAAALRCRVHAWGKLGLLLTVAVYCLFKIFAPGLSMGRSLPPVVHSVCGTGMSVYSLFSSA